MNQQTNNDAFEKWFKKEFGEAYYPTEAIKLAWQAALTHAEQQRQEQEPVAYIHRNEYDEYRLEPMDSFKIKSIPRNVDIHLFATPPYQSKLIERQASEIAELTKQRDYFHGLNLNQANTIDELQAINNDLRKALEHADEFIRNGVEFGYIRMPDESLKGIDSAHDTPEIIRKALASTPAQSLARHDDEVIERCANAVEEVSNNAYCVLAVDKIRALKAKP